MVGLLPCIVAEFPRYQAYQYSTSKPKNLLQCYLSDLFVVFEGALQRAKFFNDCHWAEVV